MLQNKPEHVNTSLIETLLVVLTCVTCITLIILLTLVITKIINKGSRIAKTDLLPMYQFHNGNTSGGSDTLRTVSTTVADSRSRIPTEDRVPSSGQSGYDNPVMLVPSPPTSANRRNRLPPLS